MYLLQYNTTDLIHICIIIRSHQMFGETFEVLVLVVLVLVMVGMGVNSQHKCPVMRKEFHDVTMKSTDATSGKWFIC